MLDNRRYHIYSKNRRQFLKYMLGGTLSVTAIALLFPKSSQSRESELENLCSLYPLNSRCENYLPGAAALDSEKNPIQSDTLLASTQPGDRILAKGLSRDAYLIINSGPTIAEYAIKSACTHLGCAVNWDQETNQFKCPCHGSRYDAQGRVVEGPAQRSLPLFTVVVKQNQVRLVNVPPAIDPRQSVTP